MTSQIHPSQSTDKPDLRIVPLNLLVEHEFNDAQRTWPLAQRLKAEGLLKNPPIVASLAEAEGDDDSRFVVLDGANRVTALNSLGYPHILVQVVRYEHPFVTLTTWHHVVTGMDQEQFSTDLRALEGLEFQPLDLLHARAGLSRREFLAYIIRADGHVFAARTEAPRRKVHEQNRLLNAMVDTYKDRGKLFRATTDNLDEARQLYPDLTGLVIFPNYDPAEVLALARDGELLPTGLTRHLIQGRALRTNYPLSELISSDTIEAKNARLQEWLKQRLASKEIRFYGESTYLFDE
jgi:L-serine kinase (ATP) / ParB family transcriptional regulator, heme-responsive regulator